jgi:PDZ domain-containing secreted protein
MTNIGLKADDIILSLNDTNYNLDTLSEMMTASQNWKDGDNVTIKVKRNGKEQTLTGKAILSYQESEGYQVVEPTKQTLKEAWLKG